MKRTIGNNETSEEDEREQREEVRRATGNIGNKCKGRVGTSEEGEWEQVQRARGNNGNK